MSDDKEIKKTEYQVLSRKYRPRYFSELIGQETLVQVLTNAIKKNRVAHAYLLTGIRGVGKTTTARLIARAINCENIINNKFEPCGKCDSCKSILEEKNMDVIEMDAASRTGVDDVREIIENVKYKPTSCNYKVYIIDEVHMLSKNAFNALLKTLEEPPPHIKFLFATTEVNKIPVTILSRCQRFDLFRINNKILVEHILDIAKRENISIASEAVALIVSAAEGSVRDALSLLDQVATNLQEKIDETHVVKMLGLADKTKIYDLLDLIFKGKAPEALLLFKTLYSQGADILMIFEEMIKVTHFLTEVKILPSVIKESYIPESEKSRAKEMSDQLTMSVLGRFWQALFRGYEELKKTSYTQQASEMIIIRLIYLSDMPSPSDLLKKIEKKESVTENKLHTDLNKQSNNENEKVLNNLSSDSNEKSKEFVNNVKKNIKTFRELVELFSYYREVMLYTKLYNEVKVIKFEEGKLTLSIDKLNDQILVKKITKLISKWTGRIWTISLSDGKTGKTLAEEDIILKENKLESIKKYPDVKKILESFPDATIHSVESDSELSNMHQDNKTHLRQEKK
tara:strand:+ start:885 stop:2594 length:1710 start_codon:yes stop_codon:yes gene_type:complete